VGAQVGVGAAYNPRVKAAVCARYGPPDAVRIAAVEKPAAGNGEVLVRVDVTTVNRTDCGFRSGSPFIARLLTGLTKPKAAILGCEFSGEVVAIGAGVSSFSVGDRVFGYNERRFGAHAEFMSIAADGPVAAVPAHLSHEQAAPATEGSHYALSMIRRARIRAGHDVLVNGATGAIGSAAVQMLKSLGANVTAVCATEHVTLVRRLGAGRVIDFMAEDFTRDRQQYDVVIDAVGKSSFGRCRRLLKPGGIYVSSDLGPLSLNPILALVTPLFRGKRVQFPIPMTFDHELAEYFRGLLASGAFVPVIDRRYPLERIVDAYRYVESGRKIGNVLIHVGT
jgi:NADPH:quinone reductase-like Zn-dependent oxidoreductase